MNKTHQDTLDGFFQETSQIRGENTEEKMAWACLNKIADIFLDDNPFRRNLPDTMFPPKTIFNDDRTERQKKTDKRAVFGLSESMSGWGQAENRKSYAGWACKEKHIEKVYNWVRDRSDMKDVVATTVSEFHGIENNHTHIYVVEDGHPSLI